MDIWLTRPVCSSASTPCAYFLAFRVSYSIPGPYANFGCVPGYQLLCCLSVFTVSDLVQFLIIFDILHLIALQRVVTFQN